MLSFFITLAVAALGAAVFLKLKVPVGGLIGAMVFVAAYNLLTDDAFVYPQMTYILQVCSGVLIGSTLTLATLKHLTALWKPFLLMMTVMLVITVLLSLLLPHISPLDTATALFAMAPGGMTDMTILSASFGCNSAYVVFLHICRLMLILLTVPPFVKYSCKQEEKIRLEKSAGESSPARLCIALILGSICAVLFVFLHIKAGAMLGAMLGGAILTVSGREYHCPRPYVLTLQIAAGAFTGTMVTHQVVLQIPQLWTAVLCIGATVWIYLLLNGYLMRRFFGMSRMTSMLACVPGGLSDMTLLAEELGGDMPTVATLQTLRLFSVILIIPNLVPLVERLVNSIMV